MTSEVSKVCIIGAGAAGLCAIRHISQTSKFSGIVYEETDCIGGVWEYKPKSKVSSASNRQLYKDMRTNLPRQTMGFPDFPFPEAFTSEPKLPSFMHHSEVKKYLHSYAKHYNILQYIRFNTRVINIQPNLPPGEDVESEKPKWLVTIEKLNGHSKNTVENVLFDAVMVCNGHFGKPNIPGIPGIENFTGIVMHSKDYDDAKEFDSKKVVIVGVGQSGIDIAFAVSQVASEVYVSNKYPPVKFLWPSNVKEVPKLRSATSKGFICMDNTEIIADILIFCTGYLYDFQFLSSECGMDLLESKRLSPLYKEILHIKFTNLCFIGIQSIIIPFLLFDCQVRYFVQCLLGRVNLPSLDQRIECMNKELEYKEKVGIKNHELGDRQWQYFELLAAEGNFDLTKYLQIIYEIYKKTGERRKFAAASYKKDSIRVFEEENEGKKVYSFQYLEYSSSAYDSSSS